MRPLTTSQAVCLTVMTGALVCPPDILRAEIEKKLGRTVSPTEFTQELFVESLQDLYRNDFHDLCKVVSDEGIILFK